MDLPQLSGQGELETGNPEVHTKETSLCGSGFQELLADST